MAYRRRQGISRTSTFKEEIYRSPEHDHHHDNINKNSNNNDDTLFTTSSSSPSLAAQAIRASAAHRESSLSSAYAGGSISQRSKVYFTFFSIKNFLLLLFLLHLGFVFSAKNENGSHLVCIFKLILLIHFHVMTT